jgi:hypothetical protein
MKMPYSERNSHHGDRYASPIPNYVKGPQFYTPKHNAAGSKTILHFLFRSDLHGTECLQAGVSLVKDAPSQCPCSSVLFLFAH